jgi:hypothetical protein
MSIQTLRDRAIKAARANGEPSALPQTIPVLYVDRLNPKLILSDNVQLVTRARWAFLGHKGLIQGFNAKYNAYLVLV